MEDIEHIEKEMKLIGADGQRLDGRRFDELRPIRIEAGVLRRAGGNPDNAWGGDKGFAALDAAPHGPPQAPQQPPPVPRQEPPHIAQSAPRWPVAPGAGSSIPP